MIDANFIDKILNVGGPKTYRLEQMPDVVFSSAPLHVVRRPAPVTLEAHTLSAVADFCCEREIEVECPSTIIHIVDEKTVRVVGGLHVDTRQRDIFLESKAFTMEHHFGRQMAVEDFIIYLLSMFAPTEHREIIIRIVSGLKDGSDVAYTDDGISQSVVAKTGVARVEKVDLPNPVLLAPYRTFPEITPVEIPFVFRIKRGGGEAPTCSITEGGGGVWKNHVVKDIKAWFSCRFVGGECPIIIG